MAFAGSMLAHQAECCPCGSSFSLAHVFNDCCRNDRLEPMKFRPISAATARHNALLAGKCSQFRNGAMLSDE